jgi:short-subunit dehydrogenase
LGGRLHRTGISVKLIQPKPVDTEIWDPPGNDAPIYDGSKASAVEEADGIIAALDSDTFEH